MIEISNCFLLKTYYIIVIYKQSSFKLNVEVHILGVKKSISLKNK